MKTTKLIASIALVALATSASGQFAVLKNRIFAKKQQQVEFYTANYKAEENKL